MLSEDKEKKLIEMFIALDDFCLSLYKWQSKQSDLPQVPANKPVMSDSERLTVLVFYHFSGYKCFEYYYQQFVQKELHSYFPLQVSYERFVALIPRILPGLYVFLKWRTCLSQRTGTYFIDSKKLPVCDNHRIYQNKVFSQVASRASPPPVGSLALSCTWLLTSMEKWLTFCSPRPMSLIITSKCSNTSFKV